MATARDGGDGCGGNGGEARRRLEEWVASVTNDPDELAALTWYAGDGREVMDAAMRAGGTSDARVANAVRQMQKALDRLELARREAVVEKADGEEPLSFDLDPEDAQIAGTLSSLYASEIERARLARRKRRGGDAEDLRQRAEAAEALAQQGLEKLSDHGRAALGPVHSEMRGALWALAEGKNSPKRAATRMQNAFAQAGAKSSEAQGEQYGPARWARLCRTEAAFAQSAVQRAEHARSGARGEALNRVGATPPLHPNCQCSLETQKINGELWEVLRPGGNCCAYCASMGQAVRAAAGLAENDEGTDGPATSGGDSKTAAPDQAFKTWQAAQQQWLKELTEAQKEAFGVWSADMTACRKLREVSKTGRGTKADIRRVEEIEAALDKGTPRPGVVYRGLHNVPDALLNRWVKGKTILLRNIQSGTSEADMAAKAAVLWGSDEAGGSSVIWRIENNLSGIDMSDASAYSTQAEVMLRKGITYRIAGRETELHDLDDGKGPHPIIVVHLSEEAK